MSDWQSAPPLLPGTHSLHEISIERAGRAGSTAKGLVTCANADQRSDIERVASAQTGKEMIGALLTLIDSIKCLALHSYTLTYANLDASPSLYDLIGGIDSTLIDLAADEISQERSTDVNDVLGILTGVVFYRLQAVVEQGIPLIGKMLESRGRSNFCRSFILIELSQIRSSLDWGEHTGWFRNSPSACGNLVGIRPAGAVRNRSAPRLCSCCGSKCTYC